MARYNCASFVDISVNLSQTGENSQGIFAGGICGQNERASITNCYHRGTINIYNCDAGSGSSCPPYMYAGGIVGKAYGAATIRNCYHEGNLYTQSDDVDSQKAVVAGIVAETESETNGIPVIENSYFCGKLVQKNLTAGLVDNSAKAVGKLYSTTTRTTIKRCGYFADQTGTLTPCTDNQGADSLVDQNLLRALQRKSIDYSMAESIPYAFWITQNNTNNGYPILVPNGILDISKDNITIGNGTIDAKRIDGSNAELTEDGNYYVIGDTTTNTIKLNSGGHEITLVDVSIKLDNDIPLTVGSGAGSADSSLKLVGQNTLTSKNNYAMSYDVSKTCVHIDGTEGGLFMASGTENGISNDSQTVSGWDYTGKCVELTGNFGSDTGDVMLDDTTLFTNDGYHSVFTNENFPDDGTYALTNSEDFDTPFCHNTKPYTTMDFTITNGQEHSTNVRPALFSAQYANGKNTQTANGVTATGTIQNGSSVKPGTSVTARITLSGAALRNGTFTANVLSDGVSLTAPATTTAAATTGSMQSQTFDFTFPMPMDGVDDLAALLTFSPFGGSTSPIKVTDNGIGTDTYFNDINAAFTYLTEKGRGDYTLSANSGSYTMTESYTLPANQKLEIVAATGAVTIVRGTGVTGDLLTVPAAGTLALGKDGMSPKLIFDGAKGTVATGAIVESSGKLSLHNNISLGNNRSDDGALFIVGGEATISGNPVIKSSYAADNVTRRNIKLANSKTLGITGALTGAADDMGITCVANTDVALNYVSNKGELTDPAPFFYDTLEQQLYVKEDNSTLAAKVNVAVNMNDWTYGETESIPSITVTPTTGSVTYSYSGTPRGGAAFTNANALPKTASGRIKAGSYTVKAVFTYLDKEITLEKAFTVSPMTLTPVVTITGVTKAYDGNTNVVGTQPVLQFSPTQLLTSEAVTASWTYAYDNANAGTNKTINATLGITGADKDSYSLTATSVSVSGAEITKADGATNPSYISTKATLDSIHIITNVMPTLGDVSLPTGWSFTGDTTAALHGDNGTPNQNFGVKYTSADPNYSDVTLPTQEFPVSTVSMRLTGGFVKREVTVGSTLTLEGVYVDVTGAALPNSGDYTYANMSWFSNCTDIATVAGDQPTASGNMAATVSGLAKGVSLVGIRWKTGTTLGYVFVEADAAGNTNNSISELTGLTGFMEQEITDKTNPTTDEKDSVNAIAKEFTLLTEEEKNALTKGHISLSIPSSRMSMAVLPLPSMSTPKQKFRALPGLQ